MILVVPRQFEIWDSTLTASHPRHITCAYHSWTSSKAKAITCQPRAIWRNKFQKTTATRSSSSTGKSSGLPHAKDRAVQGAHANLCSWVTVAYHNCVQFYCTIITPSKGAACNIPLPSNITSPVYFVSESVAPTLCQFYKILSCKHFCHMPRHNPSFSNAAIQAGKASQEKLPGKDNSFQLPQIPQLASPTLS